MAVPLKGQHMELVDMDQPDRDLTTVLMVAHMAPPTVLARAPTALLMARSTEAPMDHRDPTAMADRQRLFTRLPRPRDHHQHNHLLCLQLRDPLHHLQPHTRRPLTRQQLTHHLRPHQRITTTTAERVSLPTPTMESPLRRSRSLSFPTHWPCPMCPIPVHAPATSWTARTITRECHRHRTASPSSTVSRHRMASKASGSSPCSSSRTAATM